MSLPRYERTKDSNIEWLGQVPDHWEVKRLKHVCRIFPSNVDKKCHEGETPVALCNYTDVYYNEVITQAIDFMNATASEDQINKFTLHAGDTIVTKDSETPDDIAVAAYVPVDLPGVVCGYHLAMIRPTPHIHGAFVKRLFDSIYAKSCFATLANGLTRYGLGQYELDNIEMPFPPLTEQFLIAEFLDRETAKIDSLVAEQRRLIELLKEKRQAVIIHAVSKGLNPNAPMKPSGIEWVGNVPRHWDVTKLGYCASVENGMTPSRDNPNFWDDGDIPWLSSGEVNQYRISEVSEFITQAALSSNSLRVLPIGAVIIGMIGQGKTRGLSAILEIEATINQNMAAIITNDKLFSDYLHYMFQAMYNDLREMGRGGQQAALNCEILRAVRIPIPPKREQAEIVDHLHLLHATFDTLTAEAQRGIDLLRERRTALISAAVTGKIDVRNLVEAEAA